MKKFSSIFLLIAGYLSLGIGLIDVPNNQILSVMVGVMCLSWGLSDVKSDFNFLNIPFFKKRPGLLHSLLSLLIPLFVVLFRIMLK